MLTITPLAKADQMDKSSVSVGKTTQECGSKKEITVASFFFIPSNTLFGADSVHLFIHSTAFNEHFGSKAYSGLKTKMEQTWSRVSGLAGGIRTHKGWQR